MDSDEHGIGTVFRDLITIALLGFVALVIMLLFHLNPPGWKENEDAKAPGNVMVEIRWPDALDADVDLWVQAPGDVPVGYSNKGGVIFNLLRDDLGRRADATGLNYEMAYSRGIVPGEYTVNVHLYRNISRVLPVPVTVVISVKSDPATSARQILATEIDLRREGEERTALRFELLANGGLVQNSVSLIYKPLRSAQ